MNADNQFPNLPHQSTEELLNRLLHSLAMRDWEDEPNPEEAIAHRKALMDEIIKRRAAIPLVLPLLDHTDWAVREDAIHMLGRLQAHEAVPALSRLLQSETEKRTQYWVVVALESIGTSEAVAMAEQWRKSTNFSKREELVEKLTTYWAYGTMDKIFERHLHELAKRKGVALYDLLQGWLMQSLLPKNLPPEVQARLNIVNQASLTEEDLRYLEG